MIEPYIIKYFMAFIVFMEILASYFIVDGILFAYKKKLVSKRKFIAYISTIVIIIGTTVIILVIILKRLGIF
ncbi:hypothetical protein [Clostridium sp. Marseille-Q2269]|uniref:hypothetical protein n=1 Tax=Clostridium sp. Marseille-Q2269 TaxID=2942205 RepID=UPI0020746E25|nr:hypothetical protein [Clostridium sp. Marseille-Q2269]